MPTARWCGGQASSNIYLPDNGRIISLFSPFIACFLGHKRQDYAYFIIWYSGASILWFPLCYVSTFHDTSAASSMVENVTMLFINAFDGRLESPKPRADVANYVAHRYTLIFDTFAYFIRFLPCHHSRRLLRCCYYLLAWQHFPNASDAAPSSIVVYFELQYC